jgi:hypothetical protein
MMIEDLGMRREMMKKRAGKRGQEQAEKNKAPGLERELKDGFSGRDGDDDVACKHKTCQKIKKIFGSA